MHVALANLLSEIIMVRGGFLLKLLKFADDTKIFSVVNNDKDRNQLQNDLNNLLSWAEEWQMLCNV